jgi:hypothetical protein
MSTVEITIPVTFHCTFRPTQKRGQMRFKFADCVADVTDDETNLGQIGGVMGGGYEVMLVHGARPDDIPEGDVEVWYARCQEVWETFMEAREVKGKLPPWTEDETPLQIERLAATVSSEAKSNQATEEALPEPEPDLPVPVLGELTPEVLQPMQVLAKPPIAWLRVTTWVGSPTVYYAEHFYGVLVLLTNHGKPIEERITQLVTDKIAARLNLGDNAATYKVGDRTERFFSRESLEQASREILHKQFTSIRLLLVGEPHVMSPMQAVDGPPGLVAELNSLWMEWENLPTDELNSKEETFLEKRYSQLLTDFCNSAK